MKLLTALCLIILQKNAAFRIGELFGRSLFFLILGLIVVLAVWGIVKLVRKLKNK